MIKTILPEYLKVKEIHSQLYLRYDTLSKVEKIFLGRLYKAIQAYEHTQSNVPIKL